MNRLLDNSSTASQSKQKKAKIHPGDECHLLGERWNSVCWNQVSSTVTARWASSPAMCVKISRSTSPAISSTRLAGDESQWAGVHRPMPASRAVIRILLSRIPSSEDSLGDERSQLDCDTQVGEGWSGKCMNHGL